MSFGARFGRHDFGNTEKSNGSIDFLIANWADVSRQQTTAACAFRGAADVAIGFLENTYEESAMAVRQLFQPCRNSMACAAIYADS
jgi:hypothetical protein